MQLSASELILNADKSIYHLNLLPEDLAETVIVVGDQNRVPLVSKYFDTIEVKKEKRDDWKRDRQALRKAKRNIQEKNFA